MPPKSYLLLRWIEDERVGIVPSSSVHSEDTQRVYPGAIGVRVMFGKKYFEAQILKIDGKYYITLDALA